MQDLLSQNGKGARDNGLEVMWEQKVTKMLPFMGWDVGQAIELAQNLYSKSLASTLVPVA